MIQRIVLVMSLSLALYLAPASANAENITNTVEKYNAGIQQSLPAIKDFYMRANDFQRDIYFDELLFDSTMEMGLTKAKKDTPLLHKYSEAEINTRILALRLISNYSNALSQLADTQKSKTAEADMQSIGNRIADITKRLGFVAQAVPMVAPYAAAAGDLAGLISKGLTKMKQETALRNTIAEGAPKIEKLLALLENDASVFREDIFKNKAQGNLDEFINKYNKYFVQEKQGPPVDLLAANRIEFLQKVKVSAERYVNITNVNPAAALSKMRKINQELLQWATSDKKQPFNFEQLAEDIDSYLDDVDTITKAASLLKTSS